MSDTTLVYTNATVHTMDAELSTVDAFAVADGRIVATCERAHALLAEGAESVDLGGRTVLPGLIDAHIHHAQGGKKALFDFNIPPTAGLEEILQAIGRAVAELPEGAWLTGGSVGSGLIDQVNSAQTLARLDEISAGHPVLLTDDSIHNRWANSAAMELAGIDAITPDPEGGQICRDAKGQPTGWLVEAAGMMAEKAKERVAPFGLDKLMEASAQGVAECNSFGITGFQDAATSQQIMQAVHRLDTEGRLNAWVVSSTPVEEFIFGFDPVGQEVIEAMPDTASEHHRPTFIKIFLDGVPPTRTAAFLNPYKGMSESDPCSHGKMTMSQDKLAGWLLRTAALGVGAKIHCTGDASVRAVLDAVAQVRAAGYAHVRYQVAHGQFIATEDLPRFAELNVSADISPAIWYPGVIAETFHEVLDEPQASEVQPNRLLLEHGARIAAGSDWPVAPTPNPWPAIYGLVTRKDPSGSFPGTLWAEQAMTISEALVSYTRAAAEAAGLEDVTGSLEVGKSADFIVLPIDPMHCPIEQVIELRPEATYFAGRRVYTAVADTARG
ncbi:amidohydrolase [Glutamicibacter sp. PS]|uniref:amidohydrolase n=1 Tax=Glutamicibacter sp. PS TaxID=3075634 RepID=UPI00283BA718|nr:amidohydrolase [Glutamicibacter sp. PS]MDR4534425.1 amidohydrolase [Glutamicibacter sp. PS]